MTILLWWCRRGYGDRNVAVVLAMWLWYLTVAEVIAMWLWCGCGDSDVSLGDFTVVNSVADPEPHGSGAFRPKVEMWTAVNAHNGDVEAHHTSACGFTSLWWGAGYGSAWSDADQEPLVLMAVGWWWCNCDDGYVAVMMAMWHYGSCYAYVAKNRWWRCCKVDSNVVVVLAMWLRRWNCGGNYCDETGDGKSVVMVTWLWCWRCGCDYGEVFEVVPMWLWLWRLRLTLCGCGDSGEVVMVMWL